MRVCPAKVLLVVTCHERHFCYESILPAARDQKLDGCIASTFVSLIQLLVNEHMSGSECFQGCLVTLIPGLQSDVSPEVLLFSTLLPGSFVPPQLPPLKACLEMGCLIS